MFVKLKSLNEEFEINEHAEIRSRYGRTIHPYIGTDLYQHVVLHLHGKKIRKRVHRLMAEAFFGNCPVVDHIDNNRSNNELSNLRPITHSENIRKGIAVLKEQRGKIQMPIRVINKKTGEIYNATGARDAEHYTGVDRHRIKFFIDKTRPNYTDFDFEYINEPVTTNPDECKG